MTTRANVINLEAPLNAHAQKPLVVAIDMGYGHLRPARAVADVLGTQVLHADKEPLAPKEERKAWGAVRHFYEFTSRTSQLGFLGGPLRAVLESVTDIPHLHPMRDLSEPTVAVRLMQSLARRGMGQGLHKALAEHDAPLLTTFYAPAVLADFHGSRDIFCIVTDSDINRVWAPFQPKTSSIKYLVPTPRARRRLRAYGVREEQILFTGFPLPHELVGGTELVALRSNLRGRLLRLDPKGVFREQHGHEIDHFLGELPVEQDKAPPHLTFAVGGAGAQVGIVRSMLPSLWNLLVDGKLKLTLVAGIRPEVADEFRQAVTEARLAHLLDNSINILSESTFDAYYNAMATLLAQTDILWTKPSEMTFYGALGLPLIMAWPVGVHERYNRRWAIENGAGIKQRDPQFAGEWLGELLHDGTLAQAAWSGFLRLPKFGTYRVAEALRTLTKQQ